MNYIKQVMDMLGVAEGERFKLRNNAGEILPEYWYFKNNGLKMRDDSDVSPHRVAIGQILMGDITVVKQPWIPKMGEYYWYVYYDGDILYAEWDNNIFDIALIGIGNCFRTKEEAQAAAPEMLEKFKKILSGDMVLVERNQLQSTEDKQ